MNIKASNRGALVVNAIYGLGGIGKSILAAALAHDDEGKIISLTFVTS